MVIKRKSEQFGITIDLTGPQGNAFVLLGTGKQLARQLDLEWKPIEKDMMSGDYEHLVEVFDQHFGSVVTLLR